MRILRVVRSMVLMRSFDVEKVHCLLWFCSCLPFVCQILHHPLFHFKGDVSILTERSNVGGTIFGALLIPGPRPTQEKERERERKREKRERKEERRKKKEERRKRKEKERAKKEEEGKKKRCMNHSKTGGTPVCYVSAKASVLLKISINKRFACGYHSRRGSCRCGSLQFIKPHLKYFVSRMSQH
jgi:hypothetical protein